MLPDLLEALAGDPAAAGDVLQERNDIVRALGAAEREQQQGVVGGCCSLVCWLIRHGPILPPATDRQEMAVHRTHVRT
ncbi:hypothetical protein GCM10010319_10830 [Streptomyces blastmyceticus]|uniref:Uncharacterized protein n=1 Tax=Streptomyces blastmyceticus TaxID=68180 RepID=A0ABP3G6F1_9ACTN